MRLIHSTHLKIVMVLSLILVGVYFVKTSQSPQQSVQAGTCSLPDILISKWGTTDMVERYDGVTNAFVEDFVDSGINGEHAIVYGPNGNLYLANTDDSEVHEYDGETGAFVATIADSGDGLSNPYGISFDDDGDMYITDRTAGIFRISSGVVTNLVTGSFFIGNEIGSDGNLYVVNDDAGQRNVQIYNPDTGALISTLIANGTGGLTRPGDLEFGSDGNIYVSDVVGDTVLRYNATTGAFVDTFLTAAGVSQPLGMEFHPTTDELYVAYVSTGVVVYEAPGSANEGDPTGVTFASGQSKDVEFYQDSTCAPTATPTPSPTLSPTPTVTPVPGTTPTVTPTPSVEDTPTPSPTPTEYSSIESLDEVGSGAISITPLADELPNTSGGGWVALFSVFLLLTIIGVGLIVI